MKTKLLALLTLCLALTAKAQIVAEYLPTSTILAALPGTSKTSQTFVAQHTGSAGMVLLGVSSLGAPPANIVIEIRSTNSGVPDITGGGLLASRSVAGSQLPTFGSSSLLAVDFSSTGFVFQSGVQYALAASGTATFAWNGTDPGAYADGSMYQDTAFFPTQNGPDRDLVFSVSLASVPEPASFACVMGLLALLGCLVRRKQLAGQVK